MSLETKINDQGKPESTAAAPDPTGDAARQQTTKVGGGALNLKMPEHVKVRGHEIDHLQEKTTGSWSHFYRTDGVVDPGLGSRYTMRAANNLALALEKPPAFPVEQKHPVVNRYRQWDVELIIFHAAEVAIEWPDGVIWPNQEVPSELDPNVMEEVPGGPPENPRPAGRADRFELVYDERTGEWWAWLTHKGVLSRDPEIPVDDPTKPPDDGEGDEEDGAPGEGEPPSAREGTLLALHFDGYSRTEDCGRTWIRHRVPGDGTFEVFSVLDNLAFLSTNGRLYKAADKGGALTEVLSPVVETAEQVGLINPNFETGDTWGWMVRPYRAAVALATAQPPQRPGSRYYLGRDDETALDAEWSAEQQPPPQAFGKKVDVSVDIYRTEGATAELVLTHPGVDITTGATFVGNRIANGGANSIGRLWVVSNALSYAGQFGQLMAEVVDAAGSSIDLNEVSFEGFTLGLGLVNGSVDIKFTRAFSDLPLSFNVGPLSLVGSVAEYVEILTPEVQGYVFDETVISVSNEGKKFAGTVPAATGVATLGTKDIVTIYVPQGVSTFTLRYFVPDGNFIITSSKDQRAESSPDVNTTVIEPDRDGEWATHTALGVLFPPGAQEQSLITLRGIGDVWFDNLRITEAVTAAPEYTALARDLGGRRHVAIAEGSLTMIGQDGSETFQAIPPDVLGDTLAVRSNLVIVALGNKLHRSGDLGRSWLSADLPDAAAQIIIGPASNAGPIIPPAVRGLIDGLSGVTDVTNGILQITGNDPIVVPDPTPTPSTTEMIAIMLAGGGLVSLEPGMVVQFRQAFPGGSHLSWDERRKSWVVVQPDGVIKTSKDMATWTTVAAIASGISGLSDLRLLPCDIGRWFGYRRKATGLAFTDDLQIGLTNTVSLATPIKDMMEKK